MAERARGRGRTTRGSRMGNHTIAAERHARPLRYILVGVGLLAVVLLLAGIKGAQIGSLVSMGKKMQKSGPPPEAVGSAIAQAQPWETTIAAPGSVSAVSYTHLR